MTYTWEKVVAERVRQDAKWGQQDHPDGTGAGVEVVPLWDASDFEEWAKASCNSKAAEGIVTWRDILLEEVAEAFAESDLDRLQAELVQIAAVAEQWSDAIDRRIREGIVRPGFAFHGGNAPLTGVQFAG